jgi:cytidylate kinase
MGTSTVVKSFNTYLQEGVNDPAIFKAIFLAGGPGSGKSFIVGKTGLTSMGYKVVNSDDAFEAAMKKAGMEMNPDNIFSVQGQELRGKAKALTGTKQAMYIKGRLGLVIDGTGKDPDKIAKQAASLREIGYDVAMVFVNTDVDTAVKRDAERERTIGAAEATKYWKAVQRNIGKFQQMFGKKNFLVVDNSEGKDYKQETVRAYRDATRFTKSPIENPIAKKWIAQQKK